MEELMSAVLFVYPGAMIELIYRRYAQYGYKEDSHAEPIKLAELFVYSTIVTIVTIILMRVFAGIKVDSLSGLVFELNRFESTLKYLILSILVTCVVAWIRYKVSGMDPDADGPLDQPQVNGCRVAGSANTWRELIYGPDLRDILEHCIVRITCGETVAAGFATYFPTDFEQGIPLTQTAFVEELMEREDELPQDQCYVGKAYMVYIDPITGTKVEFFKGKELHDYLEG